jgi:hypothetical protein
MTSPTEPPKESYRDRISTRLSTDKNGRLIDADAQFTRKISWLFIGLIGLIVVVMVGGLVFGFWESNLKPVATVDGTDISRSDLEDRKSLLTFRADRMGTQTSSALAAGTIDSDLANTRFALADSIRPTDDGTVTAALVQLIYKEQLAAEEGVELSGEELEAAVAADGIVSEARYIDAIFVLTSEQEAGGTATDEGIADARERAAALIEELAAGGDPEALAETYAPATADAAWITGDADIGNDAWSAAIFAAGEGEVAELVEAPTGEQLVALVSRVVPEEPDPGFVEAVDDEVGEDVHRRNVELEATAEALEQHITDEALAAEYEQMKLGQVVIERNPYSADDTAGEAHASHIIYQPETPLDEEGEATDISELPADDPAWDAAEAEAQAAYDELVAIEDPEERTTAFAERAVAESDGPSAAEGGDLGWFPREDVMVTEFTDLIWENVDPQEADVLGPVRTEFGWHVVLFHEFHSSLDVRVAEAQKALAEEGADFEAVAAEYSDDPAAATGDISSWHVVEQLDPALVEELEGLEMGGTTAPFDEGDGYHIYQMQEHDVLPLDDEDAALAEANAFLDWYDLHYYAAEDEGRISIDDSVYEV